MSLIIVCMLALYIASLFVSVAAMETIAWMMAIPGFFLLIYEVLFKKGLVKTGKSERDSSRALSRDSSGILSLQANSSLIPFVFAGLAGLFLTAILVRVIEPVAPHSSTKDVLAALRWLVFAGGFTYWIKQIIPFLQKQSEEAKESWITPFALVLAFLAGLAVVQHFFGLDFRSKPFTLLEDSSKGPHLFRARGFFSNAMTFGHAMAVWVAVSAGLFFSYPKKKGRIPIVIAFVASLIALYCSYTRGAWIGAFLALGFVSFLVHPKFFMRMMLASLVFFALAFGLSESFRERWMIIGTSHDSSNRGRMEVWRANLEIFKDHKWFGVGFGQGQKFLPEYYDKLKIPDGFRGHAHNVTLELLSGTGLLGTFSFYVLLILTFFMTLALWSRTRPDQVWRRSLLLSSIGGQIAIHVGGLTENNFFDAEITHLASFLIAIPLAMAISDVIQKNGAQKELS